MRSWEGSSPVCLSSLSSSMSSSTCTVFQYLYGRTQDLFDSALVEMHTRHVWRPQTCMWTMLLALLRRVCTHAGKKQVYHWPSHLWLGCVNGCASYTLASSLAAYVTFTTAVSVSVFTVKQKKERDERKCGTQSIKKTHIAGLYCCRMWVRRVQCLCWPTEPLVCVNLWQPSPHWCVCHQESLQFSQECI